MERQRDSREQRSVAMLWTNTSKEIDDFLQETQIKIFVNPSPIEANRTTERLSET